MFRWHRIVIKIRQPLCAAKRETKMTETHTQKSFARLVIWRSSKSIAMNNEVACVTPVLTPASGIQLELSSELFAFYGRKPICHCREIRKRGGESPARLVIRVDLDRAAATAVRHTKINIALYKQRKLHIANSERFDERIDMPLLPPPMMCFHSELTLPHCECEIPHRHCFTKPLSLFLRLFLQRRAPSADFSRVFHRVKSQWHNVLIMIYIFIALRRH